MKYSLITFLCFICMWTFVTSVSAQSFSNSLTLTLDPAYPGPHSTVTILARNPVENLSGAQYTWYVDDVLKKEGVDLSSFTMSTGEMGGVHIVKLVLTRTNGASEIVTKRIPIDSIDLVVQADTTTPPFYKGKALVSYQSPFEVVGIHTTDPRAPISFKWSYNNTFDQTQSGDVYYFDRSGIRMNHTISAELVENGVGILKKNITIEEFGPQVLLYQSDPLLGVLYNIALGSEEKLPKTTQETEIQAEPYYFLAADNLTYTWKTDSKDAPQGKTLSLVKESDVSGFVRIRSTVSNAIKSLQQATTETILTY